MVASVRAFQSARHLRGSVPTEHRFLSRALGVPVRSSGSIKDTDTAAPTLESRFAALKTPYSYCAAVDEGAPPPRRAYITVQRDE